MQKLMEVRSSYGSFEQLDGCFEQLKALSVEFEKKRSDRVGAGSETEKMRMRDLSARVVRELQQIYRLKDEVREALTSVNKRIELAQSHLSEVQQMDDTISAELEGEDMSTTAMTLSRPPLAFRLNAKMIEYVAGESAKGIPVKPNVFCAHAADTLLEDLQKDQISIDIHSEQFEKVPDANLPRL